MDSTKPTDSTEVKGTLVSPQIAGALFDFLGRLTSGDAPLIPGDATPALDVLRDWAAERGLSLDEADVLHWHEYLTR